MICGSSHILGIDLQSLDFNFFQKNQLWLNELTLNKPSCLVVGSLIGFYFSTL
ncbi:hypothetical protein LEP1GSC132_2970 [Leptospira kirschneri str. 200803703]|uniref:Uncharacterized protein n=1 Tax=Leptospira kirschneri str. 200802841 TaxID=1193047 RepID=A0A828XW20_9LEPT|nr:hypothetical protein LEP1GSC044_0686 [Leptospira kirschneri serovar Grippotyphosa str. RM52]EKO49559.1 hypothetical protein LEP1GSC131_0193 [Leptospira kirschneri str. 200802841]EKP04459.1 hypothetical protein LEP1GSC018_0075 [Leptospira kirschneri str. 2008720114]EMK06402.1 hypothetical protein LEP1GSC176_0916 [Leptospira kirschneri str. MMD1493]EMK18330.1 hypothetical protein LEP1GSC042_3188 [Leptospira kirschneri serovar Bim str. PUO 1247]EMN06064.1 hypothetical protein LEP1GSC046_1860 [